MPKPRDEEEDLFHDEADVDFVDGEGEKPKKKVKRKTVKKKVAKKKVVKKKTTKKKTASDKGDAEKKPTKRKKKAAPRDDDDAPVETAEDGAGDESVEASPKPKRARRAAVANGDVEIMPRKKKKPAAKKKKSAAGPFGAGLGLDNELGIDPDEKPADAATETADKKESATGASAGPDKSTADESVDEYGRPEPQTNYVVHVYELGRLKRTIERDFTAEMAEAYASAFTVAAKNCGRKAVAGKKDTQPAALLD
ncbi:MAG: hypothetical protein AAFV43_02210 [Planctomycetota bacterium]